jgi:hypothetical protein
MQRGLVLEMKAAATGGMRGLFSQMPGGFGVQN